MYLVLSISRTTSAEDVDPREYALRCYVGSFRRAKNPRRSPVSGFMIYLFTTPNDALFTLTKYAYCQL